MPVNPSTGKPNQPDKDKDKKAPPPIAVRSAPRATLWERLKEVKKKDLAFIAAGLLTLISAPIAQHYLMQPGGDQLLEPGFSTREGFGKAPYDGGLNMLSDGGPVGGEVITPVTGRDPSSLLMPPGGPPAPAKPAQPAGEGGGIRDALNRALAASAPKAAEAAALPQPHASLASALRGLAALAGASYGGGASGPLLGQGGSILQSAHNVPSSAHPRSYAGPLPMAGYQGPATGLDKSSRDAIEALKAQGAKAADQFNRTGNGVTDLNNAAKESVNPGGSGFGGGGPGGGANTPQAASQFPPANISLGEGLAYLAAKMRMEKAIELEFKKRELMEMLPYKIFEQGMTKIFGAVGDWAAGGVKDMLSPPDPDAGKYSCCQGTLPNSTNPDPSTCSAPIKGTPVGNKLYVKIAGEGDKDPGGQGDQTCPGGIVPAWVWKAWQTNPNRATAGGQGGPGGPTPQASGVTGEKAVGPTYAPEPFWDLMSGNAQKASQAASSLKDMTASAKPADMKTKAEGILALIQAAEDASSSTAVSVTGLAQHTGQFFATIDLGVNGDQNHYGIDKNVDLLGSLVSQADARVSEVAPSVNGIKPKTMGGTFDHINAELYYKKANDMLGAARDDVKKGQDGLGVLKQKQTELHAVDDRATKAKQQVDNGAGTAAAQAAAIQSRGEDAKKVVQKMAQEDKPKKEEADAVNAAVKDINAAAQQLGPAAQSAADGSKAFKPEVANFNKAYGDFNTTGPTVQGTVDPDPDQGLLGRHLYGSDGVKAIVKLSTDAQTASTAKK